MSGPYLSASILGTELFIAHVRWMRYVMESDRTRISEGIEAVTRAGRKVLDEYTSRART